MTDETAKAKIEAIQRYTEKADARIATAREMGRRISARIHATQNEHQQAIGAEAAAKQALDVSWKSVAESVKKDVEEGQLGKMPETPLELAEIIQRYLGRVHGALDNLRLRFVSVKIQAEGKYHELEKILGEAQKICDEEMKKLQNFKTAIDNGDITFEVEDEGAEVIPIFQGDGERPPGIRPGSSSAASDLQQRRAEAKAAKKKVAKKAPAKKARRKDAPNS